MPAAVLICLLAVMGLPALMNPRGVGADKPAITKIYEIAVDSAAHANYGLGYPVTYKFGIPVELSTGCKVYKSVDDGGTWTPLTTKTSADLFNGIECARFDYANHYVYISVSLPGDRDYLHICLVNSGHSQTMTFSSIPQYYDNRKCAAIQTHDEIRVSDNNTLCLANEAMMDACQSRQLWTTAGIITGSTWSAEWNWLQSEIDEGFVEAASHSRTHPVTFSDNECAGSRDDIISKLTLPSIYRKGTSQYVPGWLSPYEEMDDASRQNLGEALYLGIRSGYGTIGSWPAWSDTYGTYLDMRYALTNYEECTAAQLNAEFDTRYAAGQIFLMTGHPANEVGLDANSFVTGKMAQHYDYISGRKDVWYVGFGAAFMYHYCAERGVVTITPVESEPPVELPTVESVYPNEGYQGYACNVTIAGTNLTGASAISFGSGITVNNFMVNSSTQITTTITIADDAAIGPRDVSVTTPLGSAVRVMGFTVSEKSNQPPNQPRNRSPEDGTMGVGGKPTLQSSAFSDPDINDSHATSRWQITTTSGDYSSPVFDTNTDNSNLTSVTVPTLKYSTTYYWHVRYQDNHGAWSDWSAETSFTTTTAPPANQPSCQPGNVSPANGTTDVSLTPTLHSSVFSDPDTGDTHVASQWQITTAAGNYSSPVFDSSTDASNLTTIASPLLDHSATYYWHVRYQDNHGAWSDWSAETSFTTTTAPPANQSSSQPGNVSPANGTTDVSLTPTLQSSAFSDPNAGDAHAASQWQMTVTAGNYSSPVFDSSTDASNLTTIASPLLDHSTTYYWHVRYQDNHGAWSDWSVETSFTTTTAPPANQSSSQPGNVSPANGTTDVSLTPTLQSSAFSDPNVGDTHSASQWQMTATSGNYSSPVFDSGADNEHFTSIVVPSSLSNSTTYYWHVRYQDNHGAWSDWSSETPFTTGSPPDQLPSSRKGTPWGIWVVMAAPVLLSVSGVVYSWREKSTTAKLEEATSKVKLLERENNEAVAKIQALERDVSELRDLISLAESKADELLKGGAINETS
jgi:hypothetical protein